MVENYRPGFLPNADTNVRTEYGYDAHGNQVAVTHAKGQRKEWAYDALGRQISETDALSHTTLYTYTLTGLREEMPRFAQDNHWATLEKP